MCGIVGWFTADGGTPDRDVLQRMTSTLFHRGPDGEGIEVGRGYGFGHRRLSIVDLAGGAQPMSDPGRRISVTFNGEIYNHRDLRRDLEHFGASFTTSSDTEVLVHGAARWGEHMPARLNGMFAYATWDHRDRVGVVARDRLGQKPLYWTRLNDGSVLFASEVKALLAHPEVKPQLDLQAAALYLTYEYVPHPHCAFAGIHKLAPGDMLVWRDGRVTTQTWMQLPFGEPTVARTDAEWYDQTRAALSASVHRRLMADVPLGVFLSGGVDSSAIVALMTEHVPPSSIQTFSIAFEEASFDESRWAQQVADHFGTHHRVRTFSADVMLDVLPEVVDWMDEPFADASLLPTHLLSRFTREHVTVALGGDGGDELFLGYETFRADTAARAYRHLPAALRHGIARTVDRLPVSTDNFSLDFIARYFVRGADARPEFRHARWLAAFLPNTADDPLRAELRDRIPDGDVYGVMAQPYIDCPATSHGQRLSYAYLRTYMAEDILTKVDRASMATSLEVRSPFLDPELVSLVARMPDRLKLRHGFQAKHALKQALRHDLPQAILDRKKKGFGIPVAQWLKGPLAADMERLLHRDRLEAGGLLDPMVVRRLVDEHREGRRDNRKQLWTLMMLERWRERYDVTL